jgi:hypothetical protein
VSLGVIHPRRQHVQETRGCISRHARFGGSYGLENGCRGAHRWLDDYGERRITCADNAMEEWCIAGTDNAMEERRIACADNAVEHVPLIAA